MGVDQMYGLNVIVVRRRGGKDLASGLFKSILVHLEWVYADDPWERCCKLMEQYDVSICVADSMPNANEAHRFAQKFHGRVFLADYSYEAQDGKDIAIWGDRVQGDHNKKASDETKEKRRVRISRYHGIEWNLMRYVHRLKSQPYQKGLVQDMPDKGNRPVPTFVCETFWDHLQKIARRKRVQDETQDKFKMVFENIGIDPHGVHADLYCELALSRLPDPDKLAFVEYGRDGARAAGEKEHAWELMAEYNDRFCCTKCDLALIVNVNAGDTPEKAADRAGFKECQPNSQ